VRRSRAHTVERRLGRSVLLPLSCLALSVPAGIAVWPIVQRPLREAGDAAGQADMRLLVLAGLIFAVAPAFCGLVWRSAIGLAGGRVGRVDACARYGVGSLVNSLAPAHLGELARGALFFEALPPGGRRAFVRCFGSVQLARLLVLAALALAASLPVVLAPLVALGGVCAVRLVGRDRRRLLGICLLAPAARVCGVAVVLTALGTPSALHAAFMVVPALELAGLLALTPGNVGLAGAAAALALHAGGLPASEAVRTGIVVHGVETAAGISYGLASAAYCLVRLGKGRRSSHSARVADLAPARA
jgi:uncharacterized membrane protein YbhN (UPF0104 family)